MGPRKQPSSPQLFKGLVERKVANLLENRKYWECKAGKKTREDKREAELAKLSIPSS
jgi:hypothetical protein